MGGEMAFGHDHAGADAADPVVLDPDFYVRLETHARHPFLLRGLDNNAIVQATAKPRAIIFHKRYQAISTVLCGDQRSTTN